MLNVAVARLGGAVDDIGDEKWDSFLGANGMHHREDLYLSIGLGKTLPDIASRSILRRDRATHEGKLQPVLIAGSGNAAVKLSHCCRPIPNEPIIGVCVKNTA